MKQRYVISALRDALAARVDTGTGGDECVCLCPHSTVLRSSVRRSRPAGHCARVKSRLTALNSRHCPRTRAKASKVWCCGNNHQPAAVLTRGQLSAAVSSLLVQRIRSAVNSRHSPSQAVGCRSHTAQPASPRHHQPITLHSATFTPDRWVNCIFRIYPVALCPLQR